MFFFSKISRSLVFMFFILNGFMLRLCSGRKFALSTAGTFDVLLQSLPIVVSSHLICSPLPSFSLLICSLPFLASCVPLTVNPCAHLHRHGSSRSQLERQCYCAVASPTTRLVSLSTFWRSVFIGLTPSLVPRVSSPLKTSKACFESFPMFPLQSAAAHRVAIF